MSYAEEIVGLVKNAHESVVHASGEAKRVKDDNPVQPKHYTEMAISPLEYIEANEAEGWPWAIMNVIKYVSRYKRKNGLEDLKKAAWYLNHEIERMERS